MMAGGVFGETVQAMFIAVVLTLFWVGIVMLLIIRCSDRSAWFSCSD